jgi:hypothetical protein
VDLVFLSSRLPLTKTFALTQGVLAATPYPHVSKVTSHHEQVDTLQAFHDALVAHGNAGHCLFGGRLTKPLKAESRAGLTAKELKHWVVFDFDKVEAQDHLEVVKTYLPPECQQVSYIVQLSASMFRPDNKTWSGHIFMLLDTPIEEQRLKQWFEHLNFSVPALTAQLELSDSEQALHWPLDRTVAYNSKLIFIAPPKCYGFTPDVEQPITLVKKRLPTLKIAAFTPVDSDTIKAKINELRRAIGLGDITYQLVPFEGEWVLDQTDEINLHGIRTSGDHYIRFNINGGDSFAYFIDLRRPEMIRNFKGEPFLKTEEAAPDLWKSLRKAAPRAVNKAPLGEGTEVLAFYATNQSSNVKIGSFDPLDRKLVLNNSGERAARAWLAEYGVVKQGDLPHMDLVFDPCCDIQYVTGSTQINTFRATAYMTREKNAAKRTTTQDMPPLINKVMRSMLGDPTEEIYAHFLNWLAYIFQFRKKTTTAWVLTGVEGTGKGTFIKYVLRPIFGSDAVKTVQFGLLNQEYNDFLEQALFVVFEEADIDSVQNQAALQAKLRHFVTDDPITIRKMRTDPYEAPNFANLLFFSNKGKPVLVPTSDRRFNIAERQPARLFLTPNEIRMLQTGAELEAMADVLLHWPVDEMRVTKLIETQARQDMHEATTTINQLIADAVTQGNLQFFVERMPSDAEAAADYFNRFNPLEMYRGVIDRYIAASHTKQPVLVKDEDLFVLFRTLIPDTRYFQDSKTWRKRHYKSLGLDVDHQHRLPDDPSKRDRGMLITWQAPASALEKKKTSVVPTAITPIASAKAKRAKK